MCRGTPDSVDRDANIALFQEAAATAAEPAGLPKGSAAAATAAAAAGSGGAGGHSGVERFLLVATYEGRDAKASVPMQRCAVPRSVPAFDCAMDADHNAQ